MSSNKHDCVKPCLTLLNNTDGEMMAFRFSLNKTESTSISLGCKTKCMICFWDTNVCSP